MEVLIDSNVLIAALSRKHEMHDKAVEVLKKIRNPVIADLVVAEVAHYFSSRVDEKSYLRILSFLKKIRCISLSCKDFHEVAKNLWKNRKRGIGFRDLYLLHLARKFGLGIVTFDKALKEVIS